MQIGRRFLAVDWGTTNRRIYRIEDGNVTAEEQDRRGVSVLDPAAYPAEIASMRERHGNLPVLLAGMVGSTIGWREAPYLPAPAGLHDLAGAMTWIDRRTAIVPGVSRIEAGNGDVMRGEEVQLFGAVAAGLAPADALLVQPGTHCKWVDMEGGRIARFTTAMTGELFALIRGHSILAGQLGGSVTAGPAFLAGVEDGRRRDLAAALFAIRAGKLLGLRDDATAAAYASGLLIGAEVAARLEASRHADVYLLSDPGLGVLYAAAIRAHGRAAHLVESRAAFLAGACALGALL